MLSKAGVRLVLVCTVAFAELPPQCRLVCSLGKTSNDDDDVAFERRREVSLRWPHSSMKNVHML